MPGNVITLLGGWFPEVGRPLVSAGPIEPPSRFKQSSDLGAAAWASGGARRWEGIAIVEEQNRRWLLAKRPDGTVSDANFKWSVSPIPKPSEGQALVRNLWLSPYPTQLLIMMTPEESGGIPIGAPMTGFNASQVLESRHPKFHRGDLLHGIAGWEDYSVIDGTGFIDTQVVPPGVAPNLAVGTLGITGMVAYFGVMEVAEPEPGETFVISAAAGGVGSIAAQIAKIRGLRVIGIAGGKEKCAWLTGEAGLDAAIDYRVEDVARRLDALCPDGIDIYFDNVGGPILDEALARLRRNGRIVLCGATSRYAQDPSPPGPSNYLQLVMVDGKMVGLLAKNYFDRYPEAIATMRGWLASGRLKSKEDVTIGLEHAPESLTRIFHRANVGKQLLKIADPPLPLPASS